MKKIILTFMVLFMASAAVAQSYLYIDDFTVNSNQLGTRITVPVKAHFNGRLNGFQLEMAYPEGLTPVSAVPGSDMTIPYIDEDGVATSGNASLNNRADLSFMIGFMWEAGYWDEDGDGSYETYGVVKWEAGEYDEMILLTLQVGDNFNGGDITLNTEVASGADTRHGTVEDLGETHQFFTRVCHVSVDNEPDPVPTDDFLTIGDVEVLNGNTVVIPVSLTNVSEVTAFQTDLYLPEGFELQDVALSDRKGDHELTMSTRPDGSVRLLCYSMSLIPFAGNEGELFYITVKAPELPAPVEPGSAATVNYTVELKKNLLTVADHSNDTYVEVRCSDTTGNVTVWTYLPGDVNGDGKVTITDVVLTASYILGNDLDTFVFPAADMNGDGEITVTDVVLIARLVLYPHEVALLRAPAVGECYDRMSANDVTLSVGETRTVSIALDNDLSYTAFQFDLDLPDGLAASNFRVTDRAGSHLLDAKQQLDGSERVMCYSPALTAIDGNEGAVLTFDVTAVGHVSGDITVRGIEMVSSAFQTIRLDGFPIRVNSDGATSMRELADDLRIYADGHDIIVESSVSQKVVISDVAGHSRSVDVAAGRTVIPTQLSGVVLVNAGGKSAKLMLK